MLEKFSRELEIELFEKARAIDGENIKNVIAGNPIVHNEYREQLIMQVYLLVPHMVKQVRNKAFGVTWEDYISEGLLVIVDAYMKYDHTRGFRWSTYACDVLWKRFIRWDQRNKLIRRFKGNVETLGDRAGRLRVLVTEDNIDLEPVTKEGILECCNDLNDREREILMRRMYGETLKQIGSDKGISRERIRQIEKRAKEKVKYELRKRWPGDKFD